MKKVRCAVYTRKSTEEGLEQEFNTLHAQRESAEAYIMSQKSQGWVVLPQLYDDGGFTGGNMDRPALARLLSDIDAGEVDCVVVYKVDRLSRSLLDFSRILERFEKKGVSFVSVTQQFNSTTSMGKLTLNILLSFAQFEREVISERTRDKIAMARKRGKYTGGRPVLGYDIENTRLIINPSEAETVKLIYDIYLNSRGLVDTIKQLDQREISNKSWITKRGKLAGGAVFNKNSLQSLLTNPLYIGKVGYKDKLYDGEHQPIIEAYVFEEVKKRLKDKHSNQFHSPNKNGGLLKGLIRCGHCNCSMSHTFTKKGNRRYRYYVCRRAQSHGWQVCPRPSLPAEQVESFVVEQLKAIGFDETMTESIALDISNKIKNDISAEKKKAALLKKEINRLKCKLGEGDDISHLAEKINHSRKLLEESVSRSDKLGRLSITGEDIRQALNGFDSLWDTLDDEQRWRMLSLVIDRVEFQADSGNLDIVFHPEGIKQVSQEGK
jgi:site-specific DNA recombinase